MREIILRLPDTPEMRAILGQIAGHLHDDVVPHFDPARYSGGDENHGDVRMASAAITLETTIDTTLERLRMGEEA